MGVNPLTGAQLTRLGEGYAIFTNTLNHPTNSCNAFLAGETTMMGKEHFIEDVRRARVHGEHGHVGRRLHQPADRRRVPRPVRRHPDQRDVPRRAVDRARRAWTRICWRTTSRRSTPTASPPAQTVAISGYQGMKAFVDAANQSQRTDPIADRAGHRRLQAGGVERRDAGGAANTTPARTRTARGRRCSTRAINIYGADPKTGFALRPFDNVGVQYGLAR